MEFSCLCNVKKFARFLCPFLFLSLLLSCWSIPTYGAAETLQKVTIHLRWYHQFQFAGYYAALKKGYYQDAGLDVTLLERGGRKASGVSSAMDTVLSGSGIYGVSNSGLLLYRLRGKPLVVLAAVFQHSPSVLFTRKSSGISTPQDLMGKRIMLPSKFQSSEILATFYNEGISLDLVDIVPGQFSHEDYLNPEIDAIVGYITDQPYFYKQNGVPYRMIKPQNYGIDFYGDCLYTSEQEVKDHPQRVKALREASLRGWEYAMANTDEIIDFILENYGSRLSRQHLEFEAGAMRSLIHSELIKIGHMNPGRWRHIADTFVKLKMTESNYSLEGFLYDPIAHKDSLLRKIIVVLFILALAGSLGVGILLLFNKRLYREVEQRKQVEEKLRAANEEALEATRTKSQFLARMSHEIRTPMNGVIGMAGLLLNSKLDDEQKEYAESILVSGGNLLRIINNILDFTKIESGKMEIEQELFSLKACLGEVINIFRRQAMENGLKIYLDQDAGVPEFIIGDSVRLKEILINLVNNAIKFGEKSDINIHTTCMSGEQDFVYIRFSVIDRGVGIPSHILPQLFQPFIQADTSTTRRFGGTGLGLTICKQLAELMGGEIGVNSTEGEGSEFYFTIRARVPARDEQISIPRDTGAEIIELQPREHHGQYNAKIQEKEVGHILLAEDNLINQKLMKNILTKRGYESDLAVNGFEVLEALERKQYKLILMDIQMPGMDGVETAQKIIQKYTPRERPKIIALTANAIKGDRERYLEAGMDDYISKPINVTEFIKKLDHWIVS